LQAKSSREEIDLESMYDQKLADLQRGNSADSLNTREKYVELEEHIQNAIQSTEGWTLPSDLVLSQYRLKSWPVVQLVCGNGCFCGAVMALCHFWPFVYEIGQLHLWISNVSNVAYATGFALFGPRGITCKICLKNCKFNFEKSDDNNSPSSRTKLRLCMLLRHL